MTEDMHNQLSNILIEKEERYSSWCFLLIGGTEFEAKIVHKGST